MDGKETRTILYELAKKAKDGDSNALEQLLGHQELKLLIYKIANDKVGYDHADDVYQEVLLAIAQKLHSWREQADITTWVARITRNACVDFYRKLKPKQLIVTDTLPEHLVEPEQYTSYFTAEMVKIAHNAIEQMGEECRRLLTLYLQGKTKVEILACVRLPRATFYRRWKGCYETLEDTIRDFL